MGYYLEAAVYKYITMQAIQEVKEQICSQTKLKCLNHMVH